MDMFVYEIVGYTDEESTHLYKRSVLAACGTDKAAPVTKQTIC